MRRRAMVAALGGAMVVWPAFVDAQPRPTRVGLLASAPLPPGVLDAFRERLQQFGYVEGRNLALDVRWPRGSFEQDPDVATDMVRQGADVIVSWTTPASLAAKRATTTVPIVMAAVGDPVGTGLVVSLARPGGNITGFSNQDAEIVAKAVELFTEMVPGLRRVGIMFNPANPSAAIQLRSMQAATLKLRLEAVVAGASSLPEFEEAIAQLSKDGVGGVMVVPDATSVDHRKIIAEQAAARRLPTLFQRRSHVDAGGLMSYGADPLAQIREAASYVERILKGDKLASLPVVQSAKFELVINRRTANALGLTIPPSILARADEVIE